MTRPDELLDFAFDAVMRAEGSEAFIRRVISAAYYGLFHTIAHAAAERFDAPPDLRHQLARSFGHTAVAKAAERLLKPASSAPADSRLPTFAAAFRRLQEAREKADYDLAADISWDDAEELVLEAWQAVQLLRACRSHPAIVEFLLAPLIQRRPTRG